MLKFLIFGHIYDETEALQDTSAGLKCTISEYDVIGSVGLYSVSANLSQFNLVGTVQSHKLTAELSIENIPVEVTECSP